MESFELYLRWQLEILWNLASENEPEHKEFILDRINTINTTLELIKDYDSIK